MPVYFWRKPEGVLPDQWEDRELPRPEVTIAFAAIEKKDRFRRRWGQWIRRLKIDDASDVSVLADGAHGIWDAVSLEFGKVRIKTAQEITSLTREKLPSAANLFIKTE